MKEWTRNGCKTIVNDNGIYKRYCAECGTSEDHKKNKVFEKGYYTKDVYITCQCGSKYNYMS